MTLKKNIQETERLIKEHHINTPAYWRKLKQRIKEELNETFCNCNGLKIEVLMAK